MARPARLDYPDTSYHVLSRGSERRDIFLEKAEIQAAGAMAAERYHYLPDESFRFIVWDVLIEIDGLLRNFSVSLSFLLYGKSYNGVTDKH